MRGSLAVREVRASMEISTPGPITPPRYSPAPETTSKFVEVPKSTATQAPPTFAGAAPASALGGGGAGVGEPVCAELVRVVHEDRHPRLHAGTDEQACPAHV